MPLAVSGMCPTMSATSTSSHCSNDKRATVMATSVSRNISSGNAVQINGTVAEKVCNLHVQNLILSCQCISATKLVTSAKAPANSNAPILESTTPLSVKKIPYLVQIVDQPITALLESASINTDIRKENLAFISRLSKMRQAVRAIFRPDLPISFIERRIVKRLELVTHRYDRAGKEVSTNHSKIPYTYDYVELPCCRKKGAGCVTHRFCVIKDCSADLVFGADSIDPHH